MTDADTPQSAKINESLGLTSQILVSRGDTEAAAAMLRIVRHDVEYESVYQGELAVLWLEYQPEDAESFDKHWEAIRDVWLEIARRKQYDDEALGAVRFREILPEVFGGWREQLTEVLHGAPRSNHARMVREENPRWNEDDLYFTNAGELQVYRALKRRQETLPAGDTIGIYPLCRGRVRGSTREPDVILTYRGRVAVIEVDGPHHNARRANDMTRDNLIRDAGAAEVYRIPVEALQNAEELEGHIDRLLHRLDGR